MAEDAGFTLGKTIGSALSQGVLSKSPEEIGETLGYIEGRIIAEIVIAIVVELITEGIGYAGRAGLKFAKLSPAIRQLVAFFERRPAFARIIKIVSELLEAEPPGALRPGILKQFGKVSQADMLRWEQQGGHTLQRHNPLLTRRNLLDRILKAEEIPAPKPQPGGFKRPDYRIWEGNTQPAASKWASDEVMRKAIGDVIERNIDDIRRVTSNGGDVFLQGQPAGYKTGEGWVIAAKNKNPEAGVFYRDSLDAVSIRINPRPNFTPTPADPEPWYVHTAFPDVEP